MWWFLRGLQEPHERSKGGGEGGSPVEAVAHWRVRDRRSVTGANNVTRAGPPLIGDDGR
jgi:hypothetical protein